MVKHPNTFLLLYIAVVIIFCTFLLKIVEQSSDSKWSNMFNVVYFCIVTATSLGYGDYTPKSAISRIITAFSVLII